MTRSRGNRPDQSAPRRYQLVGKAGSDDPALPIDLRCGRGSRIEGRGISAHELPRSALPTSDAIEARLLAASMKKFARVMAPWLTARTTQKLRNSVDTFGRPQTDDPPAFSRARQSARIVRAVGGPDGTLPVDRVTLVVADHLPSYDEAKKTEAGIRLGLTRQATDWHETHPAPACK